MWIERRHRVAQGAITAAVEAAGAMDCFKLSSCFCSGFHPWILSRSHDTNVAEAVKGSSLLLVPTRMVIAPLEYCPILCNYVPAADIFPC
jgi:hypothetical protein